jgi:Predicted nucleic acid-binding protein, contains PIN domain
MILADSTILIDLSRGNEEAILFCDDERKNEQKIAISVMSSMELIIGCRDKRDLNRTLKFLADFVVIDISVPISKRAFQLMLQFNMSHGLVIPDAFIAATALEENLMLMTSNFRHFEMIPGINLQKPY